MMDSFDFWMFLAGLGVFLFGLHAIEQSLKNLTGRPFKKFLRNHTNNPIKGVLGGAGITAILQSSSVVSLMIMAFVGAGIITMRSALGLVFGSNLGTTLTGWIVTLIGFKLNIEGIALPMVAIGGLTVILFANAEKLYNIGRFLFGFGLLFIGLNWMKGSIEEFATNFDVSTFPDINPYLFFFVGLILTAIVQSSSAVMVIALSAISVNAIELDAAVALIIGSNIGTTVTVLFGAIKGTASKKQIAAGHVLFNVFTAVVALIFLYPLIHLITSILGIEDPLLVLVTFHTIFNLLGIIILLPFIGKLANFLESKINDKVTKSKFISRVSPDIPAAAIEALKNESLRFIEMTLTLNIHALRDKSGSFSVRGFMSLFSSDNYHERYSELKELEGEIINYSLSVQNKEMTNEEAKQIQSVLQATRNATQASKNVKDIEHDIKEFMSSSNDVKLELFNSHRSELLGILDQLRAFIHDNHPATRFEELLSLKKENKKVEEDFVQRLYSEVKANHLAETEIATLLNANREFYISNKSLIYALADLVLEQEESNNFHLTS